MYAIRIPTNDSLERDIAHSTPRRIVSIRISLSRDPIPGSYSNYILIPSSAVELLSLRQGRSAIHVDSGRFDARRA